jgi:hypothetical protein
MRLALTLCLCLASASCSSCEEKTSDPVRPPSSDESGVPAPHKHASVEPAAGEPGNLPADPIQAEAARARSSEHSPLDKATGTPTQPSGPLKPSFEPVPRIAPIFAIPTNGVPVSGDGGAR